MSFQLDIDTLKQYVNDIYLSILSYPIRFYSILFILLCLCNFKTCSSFQPQKALFFSFALLFQFVQYSRLFDCSFFTTMRTIILTEKCLWQKIINASESTALSALIYTSGFFGANNNNNNDREMCDAPMMRTLGSRSNSFVQLHFHSPCFVIPKQ